MLLFARRSVDRPGVLAYLPDVDDPLLQLLVDLVLGPIVAAVFGQILLRN